MTPPGLAPLQMAVLAGDGLLLRGTLQYPAGATGGTFPLAVLAHQYPATRDCFAPLVADLLQLGIATLAFDERGHGESLRGPGGLVVIDAPRDFVPDAFGNAFVSSASRVGFGRIDDDVVRVAAWGAAQNFVDPNRLFLGGGSVGGSGVLLAAPRCPGLQAIVTLGAAGAPAFGPDAHERIAVALEGGTPAFLASSRDDPYDGAANVRRWAEGRGTVEAVLVPGAAHAMGIYYAVRDRLLRFVGRFRG